MKTNLHATISDWMPSVASTSSRPIDTRPMDIATSGKHWHAGGYKNGSAYAQRCNNTIYRFVAMLFVVLLVCSTKLYSQLLIIVPDPRAAAVDGLMGDLSSHDPSGWPANTAVLAVFLEMPDDTWIDVTELAIWESSNPSLGHFVAPGQLEISGTHVRFDVRATLGGLATEWTRFSVGDPDPPMSVGGDGGIGVTPVEFNDAIHGILQQLRDLGYSTFGEGVQVDFHDSGSIIPWYRPWSHLGAGENALFIDKGLSWHRGHLLSVKNPDGIVILRTSIGLQLLNGDLFHPNGVPTAALKTLIHEVIHAIFSKSGVQSLFDDIDHEEAVVHHIETNVVPPLFSVLNILKKDEWSITDINNIYTTLKNSLIPTLQWIVDNYPEMWEQIFDALGIQDANGNGIPDFLDDLLRPFLDWLYEWIRDNEWPFLWDPRQLFELFPFWHYPFCDDDPSEVDTYDLSEQDDDDGPIISPKEPCVRIVWMNT